MKALIIVLLILCATTVFAATPDGAGPWADSVVSYSQGTLKNGGSVALDRSDPSAALGPAETSGTPYDSAVSGSFFSLGFGGTATFAFDNAIVNGAGDDLLVYEVTGGSSYPDEKAMIEASHNGVDWVTLSTGSARDASLDLGILPCAQYVRVTDVSNPAIFESSADGYDLDALKALNNGGSCDASSSLSVSKIADASEVYPGEDVTYTVTVQNTGDFDLTDVVVDDPLCALATSDDDGTLNVGETWTYTCTTSLNETTTNTATATANDPWEHQVSDDANATVTVKDLGCTLTQGYWKTHSSYGPAPLDDVWAGHEDDTFFLSGQTYYEVLQTPPKGNAYYILAHQYIAAEMNLLNGAAPLDVQDAFDEATDLLNTYSPGDLSSKKNPHKAEFVSLAGILGSYNEGAIGPGHC